jgi:hypothetical protein
MTRRKDERGPRIEIGELLLGLPDVDPADVPSLVDDVLRSVQARLRGGHRGGEVALAKLTIDVPHGGGRAALVGAIVDRLTEAMR